MKKNLAAEFWEQKFNQENTAWGFESSDSAVIAKDIFCKNQIKEILIPGIGYGRNAKIFLESNINVTGIEISKKAIDLARKENRLKIPIHYGSVDEMPFDGKLYGGIFCYALVHLLNQPQRRRFISNCYQQLAPNGYMIFTVISTRASLFGKGKRLSKNRFQIDKGLGVFFYDRHSIVREFGKFGLTEFREIDEPIKHHLEEPPLECYLVICKR